MKAMANDRRLENAKNAVEGIGADSENRTFSGIQGLRDQFNNAVPYFVTSVTLQEFKQNFDQTKPTSKPAATVPRTRRSNSRRGVSNVQSKGVQVSGEHQNTSSANDQTSAKPVSKRASSKPSYFIRLWRRLKMGGEKKVHAADNQSNSNPKTITMSFQYEEGWETPKFLVDPKQIREISNLKPGPNRFVFVRTSSSPTTKSRSRVSTSKSVTGAKNPATTAKSGDLSKPMATIPQLRSATVIKPGVLTRPTATVPQKLANAHPLWQRRHVWAPSVLQTNGRVSNSKSSKPTQPTVAASLVKTRETRRAESGHENSSPLWRRRNFRELPMIDPKAKPLPRLPQRSSTKV